MEMLIPVVTYVLIGLAFKHFVDRHAPPNEDLTIVWAWPLWVVNYVVTFIQTIWKRLIHK